MKLFNAIAAAVIGGSFITANPAKANGWIYVGETSEGNPHYIKRINKSGSVITVRNRESGYDDWNTLTDCSTNMYKVKNGNWRDIMPQSVAEFTRRKFCF